MKKLTVMAVSTDRGKVLRALQRLHCVQVIPLADDELFAQGKVDAGEMERLEENLNRLSWAIGDLSRYAPKRGGLLGGFAPRPVLTEEKASELRTGAEALLGVAREAENCERRSGECQAKEARNQAQREQLTPWLELDMPLEQKSAGRHTSAILLTATTRQMEALRQGIGNLAAELIPVSQSNMNVCAACLCHEASLSEWEDLMRDVGASPITFSEGAGTAKERLEALAGEADQAEGERRAIARQRAELATRLDDLKALHDLLDARRARLRVSGNFAATAQTFLLRGWLTAEKAAVVEEKLREASPTCAIEFRDPLDEEKPPTVLRNGWFPSQFENIVAGFSMPDPRGLDPSFMMAPFFACFYGMMLSDAGYGIILALLIPIVIHIVKPKGGGKKLMWVLGLGGISTIIWGALFNTWFGAGIQPILLDPMQQPLEMMALCLSLGLVHLFAAMGVGAYQNFKAGDPWAAVFDQFSWIAIITGVLLMALPGILGISQVWGTVGSVFSLAGVALVLLFAGRGKPFFKRISSGLGALYGVTGWIGDLLSYTRLFGMGLATGVVGMVINMLAGMVMGKGIIGLVLGVVVLIGGHAFNMTLNALGAYVHACRLQYIEFFGKFYQDGGLPFTPLHGDTRYVDVSQVP
jgi:V/A-type H+-transporting ATPase subunit I